MYYQFFFHHAKNHAAQHRAPHGANSADYRHEQDGDAGLESKDVTGIKECGAARVDASSNSSEAGGDGVDP